ncbi:MAG: fatty acid desaturase [Methylocystis sp.]
MSQFFESVVDLHDPCKPDARALARRMSALKSLASQKGYFVVPLWEQGLRCLELAAVPLLAFLLLAWGGVAAVLGVLVLALHYPRAGYLGHDLAHNHWGPRNDPVPRLMLRAVALFQGFGPTWWVEKHELHHAFPNGCRTDENGVLTPIDGDIDSAPWLVWDKALAEYNFNARKSTRNKLLAWAMPRLQVWLFLPLLSLARFNWSWQSIETAARKQQFLEAALCTLHWIVGLGLAMWLTPGPAWTGVVWFLVAQLLGGFLLGMVFVLNHTGMEVYDASEAGGFYDRQARSSRNTPSSIFFDWLTGGLNSQIEHHLFPTMARRNLPKMRALTKSALLECGYAYEELRNREAFWVVLNSLSEAARA